LVFSNDEGGSLMVWFYVAAALAVAGAAMVLGSLAAEKWAKPQIAGWVCFVAGAWCFLVYLTEGERSLFPLVSGWTCLVAGILAFVVRRRHAGAGGGPNNRRGPEGPAGRQLGPLS
jgi:hypothetical protein